MALWIRGKSFGTSMCNNCCYEIPYMDYRKEGKPDPDECPNCGAFMENGYGNLKTTLVHKLALLRNEVIPEEFGIYTKDEVIIWEQALDKFLELVKSESSKGFRQT